MNLEWRTVVSKGCHIFYEKPGRERRWRQWPTAAPEVFVDFPDLTLESFRHHFGLSGNQHFDVWPDLLVVFWVRAIVIAIRPQPELKQEMK